jgi:lipid II isoglutaminyl synthase (glutamine-hydrolysing)
MKLVIVHLYAEEMNIYGDNGNIQIVQKRLHDRGLDSEVIRVGIGQDLPDVVHLIIGGGGQDIGQEKVAQDLEGKAECIRQLVNDCVPMLMICGMYQLFGDFFTTADKKQIKGIGVFPVHTIAEQGRIIGNIVVSTEWGEIVGYENHSGRTYLNEGALALGKAKIAEGNNGKDKTEGVVINNAYGSYLHGPILAKSPEFADHLIACALKIAGLGTEITPLDDQLEKQAKLVALKRPR